MKIGIIGAGNIGASLARNLVAIGHDIKLANSKGADSIRDLARDIGATAVTKEDAVQDVAASSSRSRLPGMQIAPVSSQRPRSSSSCFVQVALAMLASARARTASRVVAGFARIVMNNISVACHMADAMRRASPGVARPRDLTISVALSLIRRS